MSIPFGHGAKITPQGSEKRIASSLEVYSDSDVADGRVGKRVKRRCISITSLFTEDTFQQSYATLKFSWQLLEPRRHHDPRVCERCRAVLLQGAWRCTTSAAAHQSIPVVLASHPVPWKDAGTNLRSGSSPLAVAVPRSLPWGVKNGGAVRRSVWALQELLDVER